MKSTIRSLLALWCLGLAAFPGGDLLAQNGSGDSPGDAPGRSPGISRPTASSSSTTYASDEVFGTYEGEDLDQYLFDSSSPLEFTVKVNRVFTRQDPAATDWDRLLIGQPELVLRVYDVDESPCGWECCEVDKVYLNGCLTLQP